MPQNPKFFSTGTLVELSARVEEGLPFAPNKLTRKLTENVLARAQTIYPVTIVAYVFMPNHFHILIVVKDPRDVPNFVEYLKRETAYCVNRLLGRRKHTVWCDGYDSPVILDLETAIRRLKYVYLNPVTAVLVKKAKLWPLSSMSWAMISDAASEIKVKRIPRNQVNKLPNRDMTLDEINKFASKIEYRGADIYTLKIEPNAWMGCFTEALNRDQKDLNNILEIEIKNTETLIEKEKADSFPSLDQLGTQNIRKEHEPKKAGKRMICLGKNKNIRIKFLEWFRGLCKKLPRYLRKSTDEVIYRPSHYPPGFFAPGGFLSANLIPYQTPFNVIG